MFCVVVAAVKKFQKMSDYYCDVKELMLTPLRLLIDVLLLFSVEVDSPLCIKCGGIALIESKNFL